jgi:hypothetical protein
VVVLPIRAGSRVNAPSGRDADPAAGQKPRGGAGFRSRPLRSPRRGPQAALPRGAAPGGREARLPPRSEATGPPPRSGLADRGRPLLSRVSANVERQGAVRA